MTEKPELKIVDPIATIVTASIDAAEPTLADYCECTIVPPSVESLRS